MPNHDDERMSIRAIAAVTGDSPTTILRTIQKLPNYAPDADGRIAVGKVMGLDGKVRLSRRVDTTARDREIRERRAAGETIRAIADEIGCSIGTVHRVMSTP